MVNFTSKKVSFEKKLENLKEFISNYTSAIIAYSGGIDSSLVAQLANNILGKKNTLVVIAVSPSLNNKEFKLATNLAKMNDWNFKPIFTQEFSNDNYLKNDLSRCFYCKFELYEKIEKIFEEEDYQAIFNGTNFDDLGDFRPGLDAAKKKNIVSPLVKCKINKNEVRQIAKLIGLPNWDKPAQPCLSSRVPYGVRISMDSLKRIEIMCLSKIHSRKEPKLNLFEQIRNNCIKFFSKYEYPDKPNRFYINFKISGVWENENNFGITYKCYDDYN